MRGVRWYLGAILFFALAVGGGAYVFFQIKNVLRGGSVVINAPRNAETVRDPLVGVEGSARDISFLRLNGRQIWSDEAGKWSEPILLAPGYNVITVEAEDRVGKRMVKTVEVVYKKN